MEKSHYKEWLVDFKGKTIKVTNWWNWNMEGSADLFIDDEHVDQNTDMIADPNLPLLTKNEFSEDIKSIEVFVSGVSKIKISIMVNGKNVFQDKLSIIDRLINKVFRKK